MAELSAVSDRSMKALGMGTAFVYSRSSTGKMGAQDAHIHTDRIGGFVPHPFEVLLLTPLLDTLH